MPVLPRIFNALCDASNSTGNVTIWNNTASENARIPRLINNTEVVLLLKKNPRMISGRAIELPEFAYSIKRLEVYADKGTEEEHKFVTLEALGEEVE